MKYKIIKTSSLDSFQSLLTSISLKESCDLGPFLMSRSSISKTRVLLGGILPTKKQSVIRKSVIVKHGWWMDSSVFMVLPFPSFPYASVGGIVSFLRSPVHMFCRPLSQPFTASWIPRVNHTGFLSPSLRLR